MSPQEQKPAWEDMTEQDIQEALTECMQDYFIEQNPEIVELFHAIHGRMPFDNTRGTDA